MNLIKNIIDTHTAFGVLGQDCFVALAMLILRSRRTGKRLSSYLHLTTTLSLAILGNSRGIPATPEAAQDVMKILRKPMRSAPEAAVRD